MITGWVELSGEHPMLARAEVEGALRALGGGAVEASAGAVPDLLEVLVRQEPELAALAGRLALARRTLVTVSPGVPWLVSAEREGRSGRSAAFRLVGRPSAPADARVRAGGEVYRRGGGSIDLERPSVRYWVAPGTAGEPALLREVAAVDRAAFAARAMPRLPFRRPVSLPPRLARAAANLAGVAPGDRVLDPFLGTGALLAEAALLGARVWGIDAEPAMVRGALANFAHLGVRAESIVQGDARTVDADPPLGPFDAIVTDPPYGRSSASVGGTPDRLVPEVLGHWQDRVRAGGSVVVLSPGGPESLGPPWREECRIPVRVHRSLTREFRRYRRG